MPSLLSAFEIPSDLYESYDRKRLLCSLAILKSVPIFSVLNEPISVFKFIFGIEAFSKVTIFITPPIASLPHSVDCYPLRISILSIFDVSKLEKS